jgi:N-methylhydantoinase A
MRLQPSEVKVSVAVRVGIDTGGTFTDAVAIDGETGIVTVTKTPSTPADPSLALVNGLDKVLGLAGGGRSTLAALIHGTTVATNALLEERFSALSLVTTAGFRHILEIARQSVPSGYGNSYFWVKPDRIVSLERVFEVSERLNHRGEIVKPLDENDVRRVGRALKKYSIEAVAICLIHAYANGDHERRVRAILLDEHPGLIVSLSSEVLPEYREYERAMTTCIDGAVEALSLGSAVRPSTGTNAADTHENGRTPFLIMQSNGGVMSASEVARQPVTTLLSGPAAGALGAGYLAGLSGYERVMTVDAGGTSTDICLVDAGAPHVTTQGSVGRFPVKLPMVDVTTIGTGGGSIAWIDASGGLRVGPRSAGADPGPMSYGRGGTQPTLTDANVALGRLPDELLGGEMKLDVERAWAGLRELAAKLELRPERLASGIVELADWNQVNAIRQVTVRKGIDPRGYTMVAFGGSGPLQAPNVAVLLGIETVVIPPDPGNVSAFGLLAVDLKTDHVTTVVQREDRVDLNALNRAFGQIERRAESEMTAEGISPERRRYFRTVDMRYLGEAYEVAVPATPGRMDQESIRSITARFHEEHVRLYGYGYEGEQGCEIVNVRVTAVGLVDRPVIAARAGKTTSSKASPKGSRKVYLQNGGWTDLPVFDRETLPREEALDGPSVVQEYGSTTLIPPDWSATIDHQGNLILRMESPG